MELRYNSLAGLVRAATESGRQISELVLADQAKQMERDPKLLFQEMDRRLTVMDEAADEGVQPDLRSTSGLTGGSAYLLRIAADSGNTLCGGVFTRALAAPTAGSCGILPAAVLTMLHDRGAARHNCVMSLFTASAVGMVIANNACLAGAQGGCQAECGSASAMAAAALVELAGGSPQMASHAVAIALKNVLGLVCDPVAGLVEIPCIKRNASGIANAFTAAELALAGVASAIPADEVIIAMKRIGDAMPAALRETSEGGLAATPTGRRLAAELFGL